MMSDLAPALPKVWEAEEGVGEGVLVGYSLETLLQNLRDCWELSVFVNVNAAAHDGIHKRGRFVFPIPAHSKRCHLEV